MTQIREWSQECHSCHGTGVYRGMGEGDGAAVVCITCKGTGKEEVRHRFQEFTGRKINPDVRRVYRTGAGIKLQAELVARGSLLRGVAKGPGIRQRQRKGNPGIRMPRPVVSRPGQNLGNRTEMDGMRQRPILPEMPELRTKGKCWERWDQEHENELT